MAAFRQKAQYSAQDLIDIVRLLREPGGCPWDREQTHESIRKNLIEEAYEVADAIDQKDDHLLCEELGDLLLQIMLHTRMEEEAGRFTFDDVCDGICKKLIYRHPHVFGNVEVASTGEVLQNWESLKNAEKGRETAADRLDSVPRSLPALMRSGKVQKRAADYGFAYGNVEEALADLDSEVSELKEAITQGSGLRHEMGDVLFSAVNVSRFIHEDAEEALSESCERFTVRVKRVEEMARAAGQDLSALDAETLDRYWKEAKKQ